MAKNKGDRVPRKKHAPAHGVPEGLFGTELGARRDGRLGTIDSLKSGRTPLQLIDIADRATAQAEKTVHDFMATNPPPPLACREGCDWCCYLRVGTAAPEVVRVVQYLRDTLSPEEFARLRDRVARLDEQRRAIKATEREKARLPCVLLVDHRCIAYPVRPLTCRGFNSTDASQCERVAKSSGKIDVPLYVPQMRLNAFVLDGMRAGLSESGLSGDRLELTAALRIALEGPGAVERFLSGQPAFAAARLD
jgi:hypothetical protein